VAMAIDYELSDTRVRAYAADGELVVWCPRCRSQVTRRRGAVCVLELLGMVTHIDCPGGPPPPAELTQVV
jgi:hypothetical protein